MDKLVTGSDNTLQVSFKLPQKRSGRGGRARNGQEHPDDTIPAGRVPRVSRLMALAIRFESLVQSDAVRDYADLARLGYVSRARITQIMNLLNLAPDIQEAILFLPHTIKGGDSIRERDLRPVTLVAFWHRQRKMWAKLLQKACHIN